MVMVEPRILDLNNPLHLFQNIPELALNIILLGPRLVLLVLAKYKKPALDETKAIDQSVLEIPVLRN